MHGIHSPFVYNFASKCLSKKKTVDSSKISSYLASLKSNKDKIIVSDFGARSRVFKNTNRSISNIALNSGTTQKRAILIANITNYFQPNKILEIGTSLGIATASMSSGYPKAKIITLEGCNETAKIAQEYFDEFNLNNIELIVGEFGNTLPLILKKNSFDLIFFDGNHRSMFASIHLIPVQRLKGSFWTPILPDALSCIVRLLPIPMLLTLFEIPLFCKSVRPP